MNVQKIILRLALSITITYGITLQASTVLEHNTFCLLYSIFQNQTTANDREGAFTASNVVRAYFSKYELESQETELKKRMSRFDMMLIGTPKKQFYIPDPYHSYPSPKNTITADGCKITVEKRVCTIRIPGKATRIYNLKLHKDVFKTGGTTATECHGIEVHGNLLFVAHKFDTALAGIVQAYPWKAIGWDGEAADEPFSLYPIETSKNTFFCLYSNESAPSNLLYPCVITTDAYEPDVICYEIFKGRSKAFLQSVHYRGNWSTGEFGSFYAPSLRSKDTHKTDEGYCLIS